MNLRASNSAPLLKQNLLKSDEQIDLSAPRFGFAYQILTALEALTGIGIAWHNHPLAVNLEVEHFLRKIICLTREHHCHLRGEELHIPTIKISFGRIHHNHQI